MLHNCISSSVALFTFPLFKWNHWVEKHIQIECIPVQGLGSTLTHQLFKQVWTRTLTFSESPHRVHAKSNPGHYTRSALSEDSCRQPSLLLCKEGSSATASTPALASNLAGLGIKAGRSSNKPLAANEGSVQLCTCQKLFLALQFEPKWHESKDEISAQRDNDCQTLAVINPKEFVFLTARKEEVVRSVFG